MNNEPLLTDDDIDEIASGYTGSTRDVGIFTGIEVRNRYETKLDTLRNDPHEIQRLEAENNPGTCPGLAAKLDTLRAEMSDMLATAYGLNQQLRAEVRTLRDRLAQLEAEAERNRGDHK